MGFENGPFRAQADGTLQLNSQSWNQVSLLDPVNMFPGLAGVAGLVQGFGCS